MNERIRELAEQATREYDRLGNEIPFAHPDLEKFSRLIVENCIDELITQLWHYGIDESNNPSFYKAVEKTKRQFGIEG